MRLITMGVVGGFAVLSMISAYRLTQPSNLSPFEYFGIPFSYLIGWIIFDETPFQQLFPGVVLIVAGGLLIVCGREKPKPPVFDHWLEVQIDLLNLSHFF